MFDRETLVGLAVEQASRQPETTRLSLLGQGRDLRDSSTCTFGRLALERAPSARLQQNGYAGQRALFVSSGIDFIESFLGCLFGGVIAIPAFRRSERTLPRLTAMVENAKPALILPRRRCEHPYHVRRVPLTSLPWQVSSEIQDELGERHT
jgi:acyl-CoA synthetase (AMP-forming)/AMP-acid ligase II